MQHNLADIRKKLGINTPVGLTPRGKKTVRRIIKNSLRLGRKKKVGKPSFENAPYYRKVNYKSLRHKKPKGLIRNKRKNNELKTIIQQTINNIINASKSNN